VVCSADRVLSPGPARNAPPLLTERRRA
jgi:hypothetical protein